MNKSNHSLTTSPFKNQEIYSPSKIKSPAKKRQESSPKKHRNSSAVGTGNFKYI